MKIGISSWLWVPRFTTTHVGLVEKVAGLGFDWIEFPIQEIADIDYKLVGSRTRAAGLGVSICAVMGPDRDLTVEDRARNEAGTHYLRQCIDALVSLGGNRIGGLICGGVGRNYRPTPEERLRGLDHAAKLLRPIGEYAATCGVTLGIESLVRFRSGYVNTIREALDLATRIDTTGIWVMADTFHMNVEEEQIPRAITQIGNRLVHFHANENNRGVPGTGHLDWDGISAAIRAVRYDGPAVIETFGEELKGTDNAQRDAMARAGGDFLRKLLVARPPIPRPASAEA